MGFQINRLSKQQEISQFVIAEQKLWLDEDRKALYPDGHEKARFLFCAPGHRIPIADAVKFGLVEGPEVKESKPAETKEVKVEETKEDKSKKK